MRIEAALMTKVGQPLKIEKIELASPGPKEVLVEIKATGVCHSDLNALHDSTTPCPCVLGHEASGIVQEVGRDVRLVRPGDRVVLSWLPYCGTCTFCTRGKFTLCEMAFGPMFAGTLLDGTTRLQRPDHSDEKVYHYSLLSTFASHAVVPEMSCIKIPNQMPFAEASLLGCGVGTGFGAVVRTAKVEPGSHVAVFGIGGVGISAIQAARISGAERIFACDLKAQNLEFAKQFGATDTILIQDTPAEETIRAATGGSGVDYAIDATGSPVAFQSAFSSLKKGGSLVVVGAFASGKSISLPGGGFHRMGKSIQGSFYGDINPLRDLPMLAELYLKGKLQLSELVLEKIPLKQINEAFATFANPQALTAGRSVVVLE